VIGGVVWVFKDDPPLVWRIVFWTACTFFVVFVVMRLTSPWWAPQAAAPNHPYGVQFKGSRTYYFWPAVGWLMQNGLWIFFALLALEALITWLHRDQLERF